MTQVIINADDLGISLNVNKRIEEAIAAGVITSSTIMANGSAFEDAVRIAKQHPEISFGAHLNIIEFAPLTNSRIFQNNGLLNANGEFIEGAIYLVPHYSEELKRAIFEEFDAQISKITNAGINISHIDSHQHTHTIYDLRDVILALMQKHKILRVRRCRIPSIKLMLLGAKKEKIILDKSKAVIQPKRNVVWRRFHLFVVKYQCYRWLQLFRSKAKITDKFYAYHTLCDNWQLLKRSVDGKCVELMCHPAHPSYEFETQKVFNKSLNTLSDVRLVTYNDL